MRHAKTFSIIRGQRFLKETLNKLRRRVGCVVNRSGNNGVEYTDERGCWHRSNDTD